ncbi:hypothetical protein HWB52_gp34 [Pseudomonas phage Littlefix]|uniref:Uncharacterized protein n=1 Tax=Pseudomonas phage Littlefix TaxID=2079289 RepID=A0A2K9VHR4_9CAUD|nr:hypothetical protein HWB52_gp34 [Pseudomonas phage Littlefix]AUV61849.1 hypothetical protein PsPhLittlefix_gp34 [Pseudomonas phage Littlefix]
MSTLPDVPNNKIVSIHVQTTRLTGAGVEVISYRDKGDKATHWSIYLRKADGSVVWVSDIPIGTGHRANNYYSEAVLAAAKLSMEHKAFIEQIQ